MNIEDMTPEQIAGYMAEQDRSRADLEARYLDAPVISPDFAAKSADVLKPWERDVEFEGVTYRVDMRRAKSREFVRMLAKAQREEAEGKQHDIAGVLAMYDFLFHGAVDDKVAETVKDELGYDDFEEIVRIESALMELIGAKN